MSMEHHALQNDIFRFASYWRWLYSWNVATALYFRKNKSLLDKRIDRVYNPYIPIYYICLTRGQQIFPLAYPE